MALLLVPDSEPLEALAGGVGDGICDNRIACLSQPNTNSSCGTRLFPPRSTRFFGIAAHSLRQSYGVGRHRLRGPDYPTTA